MLRVQWLRKLGLAPAAHAAVRAAAALGVDAIRLRYLWQALQPFDPLRPLHATEQLPAIDVLIPAHPKDLQVLKFAVASAQLGSRNPVRRVVVIVPDAAVAKIAMELEQACVVQPESGVLGELLPWIREQVPTECRGWVIQQCIKLVWAMRNSDAPTLVLDADTILLKPRTWVTFDGRQTLCLSAERHLEYVAHSSRCWALSSEAQAVSYVTHHQLMQASCLRAMFPDGLESVREWVQRADFDRASPLSEYHCYGAWMRSYRASVVECASFANRGRLLSDLPTEIEGVTVSSTIVALAADYADRASLSFHSWKSEMA